jgi:hypothetical protein
MLKLRNTIAIAAWLGVVLQALVTSDLTISLSSDLSG